MSHSRKKGLEAGRASGMAAADADEPERATAFTLAVRSPYDWAAMLAYLSGRATPGVEAVTADGGGSYWRTVQLNRMRGYVAVRCAEQTRQSEVDTHVLEVELAPGLVAARESAVLRLRRLFDVDAEPGAIATYLARDRALRPLVARRPGLRVPGTVDGFDLALRAVLGQQVSVRGATTIAGRLATLIAEPLPASITRRIGVPASITHLPVSAERLADASASLVAGIGLPSARASCVVALARATASGQLPELTNDNAAGESTTFVERFTALPGIGAWTAEYVAMRALKWPDAFPESDLGLRRAMDVISAKRLREVAERWRPWRAYAAVHLWASLADH